jgi:hypothetical protein
LNDTLGLEPRTREFTRWMVLRMLYACRPGAANERIILRVLNSLDFNCQLDDVRAAIDYMQLIGLTEARQNRTKGASARLTSLGVAVVEYSAHAPAGIGRPRRWRNSKR